MREGGGVADDQLDFVGVVQDYLFVLGGDGNGFFLWFFLSVPHQLNIINVRYGLLGSSIGFFLLPMHINHIINQPPSFLHMDDLLHCP